MLENTDFDARRGGESQTWPDGDARRSFLGDEIVDPVTFRVSGRKI